MSFSWWGPPFSVLRVKKKYQGKEGKGRAFSYRIIVFNSMGKLYDFEIKAKTIFFPI